MGYACVMHRLTLLSFASPLIVSVWVLLCSCDGPVGLDINRGNYTLISWHPAIWPNIWMHEVLSCRCVHVCFPFSCFILIFQLSRDRKNIIIELFAQVIGMMAAFPRKLKDGGKIAEEVNFEWCIIHILSSDTIVVSWIRGAHKCEVVLEHRIPVVSSDGSPRTDQQPPTPINWFPTAPGNFLY